jgi:hypothetical protein
MSSENARDELRELVDQLPPAELRRILRLVIGELESAGSRRPGPGDEESAAALSGGRRRRLSFAGIIEDEPDAARRSEDLLREEFRRRA